MSTFLSHKLSGSEPVSTFLSLVKFFLPQVRQKTWGELWTRAVKLLIVVVVLPILCVVVVMVNTHQLNGRHCALLNLVICAPTEIHNSE